MPAEAGGELEIRSVAAGDEGLRAFWRATEREALHALWDFTVVWHEQAHELAAIEPSSQRILGAAKARIAASLAHLEMVVVAPDARRRGVGRALLERLEEIANYYNCHKVTAQVLAAGSAQAFLEACGYKLEATLPQHTFKLDVAVLRKFLL
ncbi:MAG: GNAT family N-acetyltransferase [Candidatus Eremiobacteraeota bacterium]|nr:GNAT family N-acetyltransferase [Candidatus Eremiobacteraeota bacterium]